MSLNPPNPPSRCCAAVGCGHPVESRYLLCPVHRSALPRPLLGAIREACDPRKGRGGRMTWEWLEAVASAVEWLAELEGRPSGNPFRRCLEMKAPVRAGEFAR